MKKRLFAVLASLCMVVSMVPTMAFAQDSGAAIGASGLCEHHTEHTADCGYTEGTAEIPCGHEHTEDCYTLAAKCVHTHTADCYPADDAAAPSDAEEKEPVCGHVCSEESGCMTRTLACNHTHDEACGYVPAAEGTPCTFVCEVCSAQDNGNPVTPSDAQPETCTCETLCTGEEINGDCPACSAEGAELDKVCVGAAPMLPVTALAAGEDAPATLYVGNQTIYTDKDSYWTTDDSGGLTEYTAGGEDWNVKYDPTTATLTLSGATITGSGDITSSSKGAGIYAQCNSNQSVSLTIELIGNNNTITGSYGIYVNAEMDTSIYGTDASLTITSEYNGSLEVSGSNHGIFVKSGTGDASLTINDASVVSKTTQTYSGYAGVYVQSSSEANSPQLSLTVNGGSLTASGGGNNDGIRFYVGAPEATNAITSLIVTDHAIVDAKNGGISAKQISNPINTDISATGSSGGIVFNGNTGTVYGNVTLDESLTIGEDETLTIGKDASLTVSEGTTLTNNGTINVESGGALTGEVNGQQPPAISQRPGDQAVTAGGTAEFSVTANAGEQLTYQWQQKTTDSGSEWKDIPDATTASYTIEATTTDMSGYQYRCVVTGTNIGVSVISAPATLTVKELVTYTITVNASAGGTATADKTAAAAGEIITLTATPASGYHFDGWNIVSGSVTIQNNQFTMPAGNVEIQAVFDRNSSSGGSDSSYTQRQEEFWDGVKEQIRDADPGDTIKVNARSYDRLPYSVMKLLGEQDDVTLRITWNDGDPIEIPSAFAANEPQRVYYPLEELAEMDFTQPAEPEADKPETETSAGTDATTGTTGDTSGSWTGGTVTQPAESQPEAEEPDTEPESEPETEPESEPTISEPDEETMTEPERGELPMSWILGGTVIVIAVGAGGFWFWKRKPQD